MNTKLVSQKTTLSGTAVCFIVMLPSLLQAHSTGDEHLHVTLDFSLATYGFVALAIALGLAWFIQPRRFHWALPAGIVFFASSLAVNAHHVMNTDKHPFIGGFSLPFHGVDHVLAMVVVGLWAATVSSKKRRWVFPASFMAFMVLGMVMGFARLPIPYVETGIWVSVVAMGLLLAVLGKIPNQIVAVLVGAFGIFHGYACGAEIPNAWSPWSFGLGVIGCTLGLISVGMFIGLRLSKWDENKGLRVAGALVASAMVAILVTPFFIAS
ncbi:MAG: HupE/UreJ family protein [Verrucomicrobiales bacterium]|nr:HupE/UreJ family protein [Verrucomicrobiales bacterium]